jgi:hypothetical protein
MSFPTSTVWLCPACGWTAPATGGNAISTAAQVVDGTTPSTTTCICGYPVKRTDVAA